MSDILPFTARPCSRVAPAPSPHGYVYVCRDESAPGLGFIVVHESRSGDSAATWGHFATQSAAAQKARLVATQMGAEMDPSLISGGQTQ